MKMKKLFAVLLSVTMLLAMGTTAFADTTTSGTNNDTGKITITNPVVGETYSVYQMFVLESYNSTNNTYAYTIDSKSAWYDFVSGSGAGAGYVTLETFKTENEVTTYYVTWNSNKSSDADKAAFAKAALAYAQDSNNNVTATAYGKLKTEGENTSLESSSNKEGGTTNTVSYDSANKNLVFSNLNLGYYLVDSSLGALVMLDTTDNEVTINEKNSVPSVEKKVQEDSTGNYGISNTADIGDTVTFQTTITVGAGAQNYVLHDTMTTGLTFNADSVKVYKNNVADTNVVAGTNYTLKYSTSTDDDTKTTDGCTFEIVFNQDYLDTLTPTAENPVSIVVTYTATVNDKAVIDGNAEGATANNTNTTYLSYGDSSKTTSSTTTTNVFDVDILKYTMKDGTETGLADAKFVLYKTVDGTNYYAKVENGKLTGWTKNLTQPTNETDKTGYATTLTSGSDGKISVDGLDADTYYLEETAAPDGYNKLAEPVKFIITEEGKVTDKDSTALTNDTVKIENKTGSELPSTGGIGTTIFYIVGSLLVVGAVIFFVVRRRMRTEKQPD